MANILSVIYYIYR